MNKEEIKSKTELSPFFFENKLYEFSQKKLNEFERDAMKSMTVTSPEAKYKIGMVLLSLEYLEKMSSVTMEVDTESLLKAALKKDRLKKVFNILFFLVLTLCFFTSGYIFLNSYYKSGLF